MKIEKMVLGLGNNSRRSDGSQNTVVFWESFEDIKNTTIFYLEIKELGWDIETVIAQLKTGEYVLGSGHSTKCGTIISKDEFIKCVTSRILQCQSQISLLNSIIKK